jgi:hypothetical protein
MAMKRRLEEGDIERQLKCKIRDVGLCILRCCEEYHTKERFRYVDDEGGGRR